MKATATYCGRGILLTKKLRMNLPLNVPKSDYESLSLVSIWLSQAILIRPVKV